MEQHVYLDPDGTRIVVAVQAIGYTRDHRIQYAYRVTMGLSDDTQGVFVTPSWMLTHGRTVMEGTDLHSGAQYEVDEWNMLGTLGSFLSAWDEALEYERSDNRYLFPEEAAEVLAPYLEDLCLDLMAYDRENEEEL